MTILRLESLPDTGIDEALLAVTILIKGKHSVLISKSIFNRI